MPGFRRNSNGSRYGQGGEELTPGQLRARLKAIPVQINAGKRLVATLGSKAPAGLRDALNKNKLGEAVDIADQEVERLKRDPEQQHTVALLQGWIEKSAKLV